MGPPRAGHEIPGHFSRCVGKSNKEFSLFWDQNITIHAHKGVPRTFTESVMKKFLIIFFFGGGFQTSLSFNSIFQERFEASMYTLDVQNGVKKRNLKEMAHSQFSKLIPHCIDNNLCISTEIKAYQPRGSPVSFYSEKKCSHCLSLSLSSRQHWLQGSRLGPQQVPEPLCHS